MNKIKKTYNKNPLLYVVSMYVLIGLLGSIILRFPILLKEGSNVNALDGIFMSFSSLATTGLTTVSYVENYNYLGWIVYIIIFNIGGVGIIVSNTVLMLAMGKKIGYRNRLLAKYDYNKLDTRDIVTITRSVIKFFILVEIIGTILIFLLVGQSFDNIIERFMNSFFLSASAVSGSGFYDTTEYANAPLVLFVVMGLMTFSFIGYPVVLDVRNFIKSKIRKKKYRFSTFTKISVGMNLITVVLFSLIFFLSERDNTMLGMGTFEQINSSLYMSISTKSVGLSLFTDFTSFNNFTLMFFIIFMIIGGAPSSACGGIKVLSVYVIWKHLIASVNNGGHVFIGKYLLKPEVITRSYFLLVSFVFLGFISSVFIFLYDSIDDFLYISFDVISGFTTTGFSTGALAQMSDLSIVIIAVLMLIGRIGIINIVGAISTNSEDKFSRINYLEKDLAI